MTKCNYQLYCEEAIPYFKTEFQRRALLVGPAKALRLVYIEICYRRKFNLLKIRLLVFLS